MHRRIREINLYERRVEEIFEEVVKEVDREGKIPLDDVPVEYLSLKPWLNFFL